MWAVHGLFVGCLWATRGHPIRCSISYRGMCGMECPRTPHGLPMGGSTMPMGCPWTARELPVGCPWRVCGLPVGVSWTGCGLSVARSWAVRGLSVCCPSSAGGLSVGFPWAAHLLPVRCPCAVRGLSLGCPWTACGLPWEAHGHSTRSNIMSIVAGKASSEFLIGTYYLDSYF